MADSVTATRDETSRTPSARKRAARKPRREPGRWVREAKGMLALASDTLSAYRIHKGGVIGWSVAEGLALSVGAVGTWIILIALVAVGVLFVTQISYGVLSRALRSRLARVRQAATPNPAQ